jgi:membrane protease YdiL (CAAX protease family)
MAEAGSRGGGLPIGAVASGVVFLAVHFPAWGLAGAIPQAVFTVALVALYARTRNTVSAMIAHLVINAVAVDWRRRGVLARPGRAATQGLVSYRREV